MSKKKNKKFYKEFYDENRIALLQYKSLRKFFHKMVTDVMGEDYYNMGNDVYDCDQNSCEDVARKANESWFKRLFGKL